jgi:hypothetical protein
MRKPIFVLVAIIFAASMLHAEDQMLFSGKIVHGGFGAPVAKITKIKDQNAILIGGRGGWIINHTLVLGLGGYALVNENIDKTQIAPGHSRFMGMGYGGFELEYIILPHQLFHPTIGILAGGGSINYIDRYYDEVDDQDDDDFDGFFILEPAASVELNVIPLLRANFGVSYRMVSGVEYYGLKDSDFSGLSANLTLKFGKF